jgi:Dolichyl-phosphate-mannose-protein mannosyltransferase
MSLRRRMLGVAVAALGFRIVSAMLAFVTNVAFPDYQREQFTVFGRTDLFWDSFARWDSGWYYQIARFGYHYTPGGRDTIAFMPVYPMLMRYIGRAFGRAPSDIYLAGVVISWLSFVVAMVGLYRLACLDLGPRRAGRAVVLAAVFPFAYFFGAVYTEATFLAAVVWTFYFFRTRRWVLGGLCGAVATATRVNGILLVPALAWIVWREVWRSRPGDMSGDAASVTAVTPAEGSGGALSREDSRRGRERVLSVIGLALVTVGIGAYSAFIYQLSGHPFEWVATIQRWGYYPGGSPWLALVRLVRVLVEQPYQYLTTNHAALYDTLNGMTGLLFVLSIPIVWYRFGAAYGAFMALSLWLPLSSGQYEGLGRYCSTLFPFFILIASVPSREAFGSTLVLFAMFYTLCQGLFVNIHPLF